MSGWQSKPFKIDIKKGDVKAFCTCGFSNTAPFCDGSHSKSTEGKKPNRLKFEKDETLFVCGCLTSNKLPFCDGSHKKPITS